MWRYNQHYFDDLNAKNGKERSGWHRDLLLSWVKENSPALGSGWEPYPTSLRIVNWVKWALAGNELPQPCFGSLAVQARWLEKRLEFHLLGNHLFANAKALIFAGCFFSGAEADRWLKRGVGIIQTQLPEQILSDGGHFERSTMYHALALEDVLDLHNLLLAFPDSLEGLFVDGRMTKGFAHQLRNTIPGMIHWLDAMRHPDGEISLFNDAAFGIAPDCNELFDYAARLGFNITRNRQTGLTELAESGYFRLEKGPACVLFDAAPVGPDYLPGHAHADTLSLEMSLFGQRIFVNSGTSEYGTGQERLRQRSTAAHNTVEVDGENSSEVWSGFRVARRAKPFNVVTQLNGDGLLVSACHDGYCRLPGKVATKRVVTLTDQQLTLEDSLDGGFESAVARFYCHPSLHAEHIGDGAVSLSLREGRTVLLAFEGAANIRVVGSTWHPRFGVSEKNQCIIVDIAHNRLISKLNWGSS
ncbi:alginate lyase family protein [Marinobacter sp. CHS3-4]|uniref:heparinase II/III family protein n=1 Tax=Marinobacter sp. CHS3-4 TaxID=3045174 RepID=UPI0024B49843|nr:alginate lyase family protein [Marinobacter sp. CHS3-4]MDI9245001.1 alginate lyase family protein [Marinobacter sp. CHS3-4]